MITRDEILEFLGDALFADGFDDCIIGFTDDGVVAYDRVGVIETLVADHGMDVDEAEEYFCFNISGAYVGPKAPIFIQCSL